MEMITLAIHRREKATILENLLIENNIKVKVEEFFDNDVSDSTKSYRIRISKNDVNKALLIIEKHNLFATKESLASPDNGLKRILVAVDFSDYSINACGAAFDLAKRINAKVKILNVIPYIQYPCHVPFADQLKEPEDVTILDKARKQMLELCFLIDEKITAGEFPSINYSYSLREGIVEEEVRTFVKEYHPHILVIGTKGLDASETGIVGGVAADIIESTSIPVLAVPLNTSFKDFSEVNHIAFLTNFDERDVLSFVALTKFFEYKQEVKITLIHIKNRSSRKDVPFEKFNSMLQSFKEDYPQYKIEYKQIESENIIEPVLRFVEEENVQVLSLNTQRRNLFGRVFMPSVSRRLLTKSDTVLLILRGKQLKERTLL